MQKMIRRKPAEAAISSGVCPDEESCPETGQQGKVQRIQGADWRSIWKPQSAELIRRMIRLRVKVRERWKSGMTLWLNSPVVPPGAMEDVGRKKQFRAEGVSLDKLCVRQLWDISLKSFSLQLKLCNQRVKKEQGRAASGRNTTVGYFPRLAEWRRGLL